MLIALFDLTTVICRLAYKLMRPQKSRLEISLDYAKHLGNMMVLYVVLSSIYYLSRRYKMRVAHIEETVLTGERWKKEQSLDIILIWGDVDY